MGFSLPFSQFFDAFKVTCRGLQRSYGVLGKSGEKNTVVKPSTAEFNLQLHYHLSEIESLILSLFSLL